MKTPSLSWPHVALDVAIVVCLSALVALGKLDAMVLLAVVGPLVGAKVASHVGGDKGNGGAAVMLLVGAWSLVSGWRRA